MIENVTIFKYHKRILDLLSNRVLFKIFLYSYIFVTKDGLRNGRAKEIERESVCTIELPPTLFQ